MATPIDLRTELDLDGTWTNITSYVYDRDQIRISLGRSSEGVTPEPSRCSLTLNNRDGRFSPRNPVGAYYGTLGRNTPIRVSVPYGETYMKMTQTGGETATTPDAAVLDITGDIDIRFDATLKIWWKSQGLAAKYSTVGDNRSWAVIIDDDGLVSLLWSPDGTLASRLIAESTVPLPLRSGRQAVRVTLDVNNGAAGNTTTFYTSGSISGAWTQLGDTVVKAATTSIFSGNASVEAGSAAGIATDYLFGEVHALQVLNGIGGTVVANPNFAIQTAGAASFADTTASPRTWTLGGGAVLDDRDYRFHGEVSSWPQRWDQTGRDAHVSIEASGVLRRIGQGESPLNSTIYRGVLADDAVTPVAYWPCEDGSGSTVIASAVAGGFPMQVFIEQPSYAALSTFVGSKPLPTFTDSQWDGRVAAYTGGTAQQVRFLLYIETANNAERVFTVYTTGTLRRFGLFYGTGGTLDLRAYDDSDTLVASSGAVAFAVDGKLLRVSIQLTQVGADVQFTIVVLEVGESSGSFDDTTAPGQTFGRIVRVGTNAGGNLTDTTASIGHISVHNEITSIFDLYQELTAYSGEKACTRLARLAAENDVEFSFVGIPSECEPMGPQTAKNLTDLMNECAEADLGLLYEPRDELGIRYRTRTNLYNRSTALELTYSDHELASPLDPVDDDSFTRNDVTVSRPNGSSARAVLTSGRMSTQRPPDGVGVYDDAPSVNLEDDTRLQDHAGWRLLLGTVDEARYPRIDLNLRHPSWTAARLRLALSLDMGEKTTIDGLPSGLPPDDISLLALGYAEVITGFEHTMSINCVPESPYRVGELDDELLGRLDTAGSTLRTSINSTATSIDVNTTTGPVWAVDPAEFPFDVVMGGEVMTVTAIAESDGDFELTGTGWTGTSCTIVQSATRARRGGFSGLMTVTGAPSQAFFRPNTHAFVTTGNSYKVELWAFSVGGYGTVSVAIDWLNAALGYLSTSAASFAVAAGAWTRLVVTATAPANAARADFGPTVTGSPAAGTQLWFDRIRLTPWDAQTFTVTRSTNGVVKSHTAGADIRLLQPMIVAL